MFKPTLDKLIENAIIDPSLYSAFEVLCKELDKLRKEIQNVKNQITYSRDAE